MERFYVESEEDLNALLKYVPYARDFGFRYLSPNGRFSGKGVLYVTLGRETTDQAPLKGPSLEEPSGDELPDLLEWIAKAHQSGEIISVQVTEAVRRRRRGMDPDLARL